MKSIMRRTTGGGGGTPGKAAPQQQAPRSPKVSNNNNSTPRFNANMFDDDEADATLRRMQQMQQPMPTSTRMQQQHQLRVQQQQQQMLERQRQQKQQQQAAASRIQQMQQREQTDRQPANDAPTPRISLEQGYVSPHMFQQEEPRQQQPAKQQQPPQKQQLSKQQQPQVQRAQPSPYQPAQPQDRMKFMQQQAVDMNDSSRQYISPSMFESDHERELEAEEESGLASLLGSRSRSRSPNLRPKSPQRVGSNSSISSNKSATNANRAQQRQSQLSPPRATATTSTTPAAKTSPPRRQTSLQKAVATPAAAAQAQAPPPGAFEVPQQKQQQPAAAAKLTPAQQAQQMKQQQQQQAQQRQLQQQQHQQQQPAAAAKLTPAQQAQQLKQQQQQEAQQRQLQQQQQQQQAQQQQQRQVMQQPQQAKAELPAPQEVKPTPAATPNPAAAARSAQPAPQQQQQPAATNGNGNTSVVQQPASTPTPLQAAAAPSVPAAAAAPPQPAVTAMTEEQLNRILAQIQQIQVQVPPPPAAPVVAAPASAAAAAAVAPAPMKQRELVKPRVGGINRHGAWTGTGHHGRGQEPRTYKCFREFVDEHESFRMLSDIEASCTRCPPGSVPQFGMATVENEDEEKPALYQCMRALQEFMNAHGMEGVFMVIKPDLTEVNMLENPFFATRADVLEWCADLVRGVWTGDPKQNPNTWDRQSACPYDQINSHWAAMALLNSFCSPMLRDCILWSLPEKDRSGPRVLLEMLTRSSPPEFAHMRVGTLVNEITKMSLKDEPDENVQSYNYKLSAKIEEIKINAQIPGKLIPPSLAAITLLGFQDCSDDTLRYEATELLQKAEQRSFPQIEPEGCLQELEALYLDRHFHELYCAGKTIKTKENEENNNNWSSHGGGLVSYLDGSIRSLNTSRRFGSENEGVRNKPKEKKRPSLSPLPW